MNASYITTSPSTECNARPYTGTVIFSTFSFNPTWSKAWRPLDDRIKLIDRPPPVVQFLMSSSFSNTSTSYPRRRRYTASNDPARPAPTIDACVCRECIRFDTRIERCPYLLWRMRREIMPVGLFFCWFDLIFWFFSVFWFRPAIRNSKKPRKLPH